MYDGLWSGGPPVRSKGFRFIFKARKEQSPSPGGLESFSGKPALPGASQNPFKPKRAQKLEYYSWTLISRHISIIIAAAKSIFSETLITRAYNFTTLP